MGSLICLLIWGLPICNTYVITTVDFGFGMKYTKGLGVSNFYCIDQPLQEMLYFMFMYSKIRLRKNASHGTVHKFTIAKKFVFQLLIFNLKLLSNF